MDPGGQPDVAAALVTDTGVFVFEAEGLFAIEAIGVGLVVTLEAIFTILKIEGFFNAIELARAFSGADVREWRIVLVEARCRERLLLEPGFAILKIEGFFNAIELARAFSGAGAREWRIVLVEAISGKLTAELLLESLTHGLPFPESCPGRELRGLFIEGRGRKRKRLIDAEMLGLLAHR